MVTSSGAGSPASLSVPAGQCFTEWLASWDSPQMERWLSENKCANHAALFAQHDITGSVLLDVDHEALKEMGIHSVGERVKIAVAVKKLRQAVMASQSQSESLETLASPPSLTRAGRHPPPPLQLHQADGSIRGHPPQAGTQNNNNVFGHMHSASSGSSSSSISLMPTSSQLQQSTSASPNSTGRRSPMTMPRSHGPGSAASGLPAPKSSLPPPPTRERTRTSSNSVDLRGSPLPLNNNNAARTNKWNQHVTAPGFSTRTNGTPGSATGQPERSPSTHRKVSSASPGLPVNPRPGASSSSNTPGYGHHQPLSSHPFATNISPTLDQFPPTSSNRPSTAQPNPSAGSNSRPSTAGTTTGSATGLSPINESHSQASSPVQNEHPRSIQSTLPPSVLHSHQHKERDGYAVGKGSFATRPPGGSSHTTPASLEDLLKRAVKFVGEEGEYKMVNVEGCKDASDILARVLRKFGKLAQGERGEDQVAEMDGWAVFAVSTDGSARALSDHDLFNICQSTNRPERQKGLSLRRLHHATGSKPRKKSLPKFFGEQLPLSDARGTSGLITPDSPTAAYSYDRKPSGPVHVEPASPELSQTQQEEEAQQATRARKSLNRASALSVLSGLDAPPASAPARASQRIRSFFGHRPPSELISNHLSDYFPSAEKKLLNKTRSSVRRSVAARHHPLAWETGSNRFSVSSAASSGLSIDLPPPPLPSKFSGNNLSSHRISSYAPKPLNDARLSSMEQQSPPAEDEAADVASLRNTRPQSRTSHLSVHSGRSSTGPARDSDTASLLTIDEITAEVEQRRQSTYSGSGLGHASSFDHSDSTSDEDNGHAEQYDVSHRRPSVALPHEEPMMDDDEEEEDDDDDDDDEDQDEDQDDEDDEDAGQDDAPEKVTSKGSKNQIKWIKGALIGSGSFGQVFLAMNAINGTLMAVKQVEIPSSGENESRKKSMVDAMEREIELLKGLQHPNIVEYLDSSSDANHLNIFLEYVPGGSVTALLRNYGAFEEPLVRTFIKQCLQGLNYLHERDIIHRDIKGANILVDNKGSIKISDFGISKRVENNFLSARARASLQGSVFWMAPEVVKQTSYTNKADIWSLGCVTIEMLTGDHPYVNLNQMQALFKIGTASAGPEIPSDITADAQRFLELTFSLDYTARPSATELLQSAFIGGEQQTPTATTFSL